MSPIKLLAARAASGNANTLLPKSVMNLRPPHGSPTGRRTQPTNETPVVHHNKKLPLMSVEGQSAKWPAVCGKPAYPPISDINHGSRHGSHVPILLQKWVISVGEWGWCFYGTALDFRPLGLGAHLVGTNAYLGYARHGCGVGGGRTTNFASRRRFCATAASVNSSRAPHGPRNRRRPSFKIRLR